MPLQLTDNVITIAALERILLKRGGIYAGIAESKERLAGRRHAHERNGFAGTMLFAKTQNMYYAENRLLEHRPRHNKQRISNAPEKSGYVYVIKGVRHNK